jgi:hypothetical protein
VIDRPSAPPVGVAARSGEAGPIERLLLDEHILADGRVGRVWAILAGHAFRFEDDEGTVGMLPIEAVEQVMQRYGRELESSVALDGEVLAVPGNRQLRRLRYHAQVDAIARDYLVWQRDGAPPIAVLATHATAALKFLLARMSPRP